MNPYFIPKRRKAYREGYRDGYFRRPYDAVDLRRKTAYTLGFQDGEFMRKRYNPQGLEDQDRMAA